MPYLFVGAGQAGSSLVDEVFAHNNMEKIATPLVFNSTIRDLQNLSNINRENWYGVAETAGLVPGTTEGFEEKVTGGFGRNPVRADEVMAENRDVLDGTLRDHLDNAEADADDGDGANVPFAFLFAGLGGGTGCGVTPHIAEAIDDYSDGTCETIAVCVLPNTQGPVGGGDDEETSPSRQAWNAWYGLDRIEDAVDGIILVDNQQLSYHEAAEGQFTDLNEYVAASLVDLVSGTVLEQIDRSNYGVDPPIIDIQDIVTSLSFGVGEGENTTGYASLGRSVEMTKSLSGYLLPFVGKKQIDAAALAHVSDMKQTLTGVDSTDARKAIGLLRSPSRYVAETNYQIDTSKLRSFLTGRCDEVNLGVTLTNRNLVSFTTLFTYRREDLSRLEELSSLAKEYEHESEAVVA
jgi:cell division GTPase FtsZ